MVTRYRARWVLPIDSAPLEHAWVDVEDGRVAAVGVNQEKTAASADANRSKLVDLGDVAVLPGLINAHTHLELSGLRGRVPRTSAMPLWVRQLMGERRQADGDGEEAICAALQELRACGTAAVGDVSNTLASVGPLTESSLAAVVFHELIGFSVADGDAAVCRAIDSWPPQDSDSRVQLTLGVHAPYSVSPSLIGAIHRAVTRQGLRTTVHLAESQDELQFLADGTGRWRELLDDLGAWSGEWAIPACGATEYLERLGVLGPHMVVVHGVHLTDRELETLASHGVTLVTCPRSNAWTGAGTPPIERFFASRVSVAVGTDSLASVDDLNLFAELAEMRRLAPSVSAQDLLRSATQSGARALGLTGWGIIAPGAHAALIAIDVPPDVEGVEEYLVGGIGPASIRWVEG